MIEQQLATVRRYDRAEAAQRLNIPETWLKRWVSARVVPHQRSRTSGGKQQRGVWFTQADILAIGAMLPELMEGHSGDQAVASSAGDAEPVAQPTPSAAGQQSGERRSPSAPSEPPVVDIAAWAQLRAHRPRPRST